MKEYCNKRKNFKGSTMLEEKLNGQLVLRMNSEVALTVDLSTIMKEFAKNKALKSFLK
jgi:hypothetical protein